MRDLPGVPSRRTFLKASAATAVISTIPLSSQAATPTPPVPLDEYQPKTLSPVEWAFVMAAVARLIPSDGDGPGAIEVRVPVFIDNELGGGFGSAADWYMEGPHQADASPLRGYQTPLTPLQIYQQAIPVFNEWCQNTHGKIFADLDADTQNQALASLQKDEMKINPELRDFFTLLLQNTKEGYFADPMYGGNHGMQAWTYIGFPGARASYKEWVGRFNVQYPLGPVSISGERA
ncbi:gluconate 2-dehydrogenase subunit 3 family protein [Tianweitania sp. BSSL-BM11]|uniref:Gluconate 2-dehydrogenase subunit 3 family protein n=1 Tax=Tianweitania aestuarii TaxID=2814886 RepID=A0ABS5RTK8_9HYPH|nr:gluconate 2-dehydrogenase subunit 3 family protein [Tianweitania aestuarii]MBS9719579.1 gluconate 2-dehydrogenase subunit 3 family protein [Tianweitania aestuarii]